MSTRFILHGDQLFGSQDFTIHIDMKVKENHHVVAKVRSNKFFNGHKVLGAAGFFNGETLALGMQVRPGGTAITQYFLLQKTHKNHFEGFYGTPDRSHDFQIPYHFKRELNDHNTRKLIDYCKRMSRGGQMGRVHVRIVGEA